MLEFFVKRPVTTIMFVLIFVVLGFVAYIDLPIEELPQVDFPIVTVSVVYPGATPLEVETQVINKIEEEVSEIADLKKIRSDSYESLGFIFIEFELGSDVNIKSIEVKDKVEAILNEFPDSIEKPLIEKYDPLKEPVIDLAFKSDRHDGKDLYEYADKKLKDLFSSISGVASVDVSGGKERQINVFVDPVLMKQYYVTIYDVINKIRAKNSNIPGGLLEKRDSSTSIRFVGEFADVDEISEMIITSADGISFPLKEIATVEDGYKKVDSIARFNGDDIVALSISKVSDGNAVEVAKNVRKKIPEINKDLPEGMFLEVASDSTEIIISETSSTVNNIFLGIILMIIILYLFTGRGRITFIAAIVIPAALISTMFLVKASEFTINTMTLLALATCMGTLVANAVVIIENVIVHLGKGQSPEEAAVSGTKEVAMAVLAATGTNLVVFTPIASMGGIVGQFFRPFGMTVVFATLFSLLSSFTLTPMLCALLLKRNANVDNGSFSFNPLKWVTDGVERCMEFIKSEYKRIFDNTFKHPLLTIVFMFVLLWSLRFVMPYIDNEFRPSYDQDIIYMEAIMPQGSTIDRTFDVAEKLEKRISEVPEVESYLTTIGENGVENCTMKVNLVPLSDRKRSDEEIMNELLPFCAAIPDSEIFLTRESGGGYTDVTVNVYGTDYDKLIELSGILRRKMEETGFFRSVESSYKTPKNEIQFIPDQKKLTEYGVENSLLGYILRSSVYGDDSNIFKEEGEEYKINVEMDREYKKHFDDIKEISIISRSGMIPITELGDVRYARSVPSIKHRDGERIIQLGGTLSKGALGYVTELLDKSFSEVDFPSGYGYKYAGMSEYGDEAQREVGKAFLLAVILTYMLLCAILNSFTYPIAIIMSIATSFIGVFLMMFFTGNSTNIASMLGMVMLVGLVVNNAILMLDFTLLKMGEGMPAKEALWYGVSQKFKAIIMTSIAVVLGVMPQMWSASILKTSMGAVMVGGMLASIAFTFLFTPVVFWYIARLIDLTRKGARP
ncbi:MAG: efflux RND transporter permease subunit [Candidatus Omnitrophota bacterium]